VKASEVLKTFSKEFGVSKEILCSSNLTVSVFCFKKDIRYKTVYTGQFLPKSTESSGKACSDGSNRSAPALASAHLFARTQSSTAISKATRRARTTETLWKQRAL